MNERKPRPTVGLGLIARDEEQTLPRLLASCDGAFDEVVLVDTGSQDATIARFEAWAATQPGTSCRVERFAWIDDFAAARQVALDALTSDWCVWADCDDVLEGAHELRGAAAAAAPETAGLTARYDYAPTEHAYHVRLVRRGHGRWSGVVHEVLGVDGPVERLALDGLRWIHLPVRHEGGKPRWERDLRLLQRQVEADPDDSRSVFYLAQTHRDLGQRLEAIEWYERRAAMGGWEEEAFFARYQAGVLLVEVDWPRAMATLIAAWEMRPQRLEPLQVLSAQLRTRGHYGTAHLFAQRGVDRPQPADMLFVATWVGAWGMLFELSITAYWVGDFELSQACCQRLLERDDLPELHRSQTVDNQREATNAIARRAVQGVANRAPR